jgi:hypothetical protein
MKKRIKMELTLAIVTAIAIATLAVYIDLPRQGENSYSSLVEPSVQSLDATSVPQSSGASVVQQNVQEDIEAQLKKGTFEDTAENLTIIVANFSQLGTTICLGFGI